MTKVTDAMYEAGMKYLNGRGTAWCVTDLYKAMKAAEKVSEIHAPISHEMEPHCCGCWIIRHDENGLNAVCNECGETRDLIALLAQSARPEDGWISTAPGNPLPKPNETVLIWYNQKPEGWRVYLGRYIHQLDQWRPEGGNGDFRDLISHWRPLPASPRPQVGKE